LAEDESFPSVYLRIETREPLAERLAGQSVPATLFVQTSDNGELWHSDLDEPVQVVIASATSALVVCDIPEVLLTRAGSEQTATVSGTITGVRY